VLVLHDLTELRRLEAIRRDFVANVSHELKTPLTSISGYSETLLADRPDAETTQRFLEIILGNARRMQHLVDDLLDLARIESGRWVPSPTAVDAGAIARDVWLTLAEGGTRGSVVLQLDVPPGTSLHADPDAIRQVLTNLLDNALRYTPAGGAITVSLQPDQHGMRLDVSDTGAGIAREHLPRIFERFYRVDASRSRGEGGTGLGLSIVRHLVESHGGRVFAESVPGEGTTISCWFPEPAIVTAS
jgi:two-component system phosphate regulon sensor histidine kinase PhoR